MQVPETLTGLVVDKLQQRKGELQAGGGGGGVVVSWWW